jgi:hypothetical protein
MPTGRGSSGAGERNSKYMGDDVRVLDFLWSGSSGLRLCLFVLVHGKAEPLPELRISNCPHCCFRGSLRAWLPEGWRSWVVVKMAALIVRVESGEWCGVDDCYQFDDQRKERRACRTAWTKRLEHRLHHADWTGVCVPFGVAGWPSLQVRRQCDSITGMRIPSRSVVQGFLQSPTIDVVRSYLTIIGGRGRGM